MQVNEWANRRPVFIRDEITYRSHIIPHYVDYISAVDNKGLIYITGTRLELENWLFAMSATIKK